MTQTFQHRLKSGLWLVGEHSPAAQSLAMTMLLPAGVTAEPDDRQGVSTMLAEMIGRGAGGKTARQHSDALDLLGVQRDTGVETHHLRLAATMIGDKFDDALPLLLDMVAAPNLAADTLEPSRDLCLQDIDALDDEPQERVMLELRRRHYPMPMGRSPLGERADLEAMTLDDVRSFHRAAFVPQGAVLAVAGRFEWDQVVQRVERLLGGWGGEGGGVEPAAKPQAAGERGYQHLTADTTQLHIALAYDAVPETDPDSMVQRAAAAVLSGGMSGRLFTEVREKRGLVYAVYATYAGYKDRGAMLGYAGTTAPRAQETLDVMQAELRKLSSGVTQSEFDRAIVGMKSRLVMQGESTSARAGAIASDQYMRGQPRTLEQIETQVEAVTPARLNEFLAAHEPGPMTVVTVGPSALEVGGSE